MSLLLSDKLYCFHSPFLWTPSSSATGPRKSGGAQVAVQSLCHQNLCDTIVSLILQDSSKWFAQLASTGSIPPLPCDWDSEDD
jgi:hypothetical protein